MSEQEQKPMSGEEHTTIYNKTVERFKAKYGREPTPMEIWIVAFETGVLYEKTGLLAVQRKLETMQKEMNNASS